MSRTYGEVSDSQLSVNSRPKNFPARIWHNLYAYRPRFRERAFWVIQGLIVVIAVVHDYAEALGLLSRLGSLYFLTIVLFFIPVVYAALRYGSAGSLVTGMWVMIVTIPDWALWHHTLDERLGVILTLVVVNSLAIYIGQRIDREKAARHYAEVSRDALRVSEMKYRGLFESSPVPILVLDSTGAILDSNPAANRIFSIEADTNKNKHLADLLGSENSRKLLKYSVAGEPSEPVSVVLKDGSDLRLEPSLIRLSDGNEETVIQAVLRDVTDEYNRQVGLRAYAASVLRTQEEERQRIARELHDDTIQSMVLICRLLDRALVPGESPHSSVTQDLTEARKTVEDVVNELRVFTTSLRPPYLDDLGIITAIGRLLQDVKYRSKIDTRLDVQGEYQRLLPDIELGIFRITQEALRNGERHSKARRIIVTLSLNEDELRLEICDNGTGFTIPPTTTDYVATHQLGIIGMQERANLLGGKLEIESRPGEGTRITAVVPATRDTDTASPV